MFNLVWLPLQKFYNFNACKIQERIRKSGTLYVQEGFVANFNWNYCLNQSTYSLLRWNKLALWCFDSAIHTGGSLISEPWSLDIHTVDRWRITAKFKLQATFSACSCGAISAFLKQCCVELSFRRVERLAHNDVRRTLAHRVLTETQSLYFKGDFYFLPR